jgi:AcrR family transcriptional regulator
MIDAGLTHGDFYRHFSGKDELYAAAVRQFLCKKAPAPWQKQREPTRVTKSDAQGRRRLSLATTLRRSRRVLPVARDGLRCRTPRGDREGRLPIGRGAACQGKTHPSPRVLARCAGTNVPIKLHLSPRA